MFNIKLTITFTNLVGFIAFLIAAFYMKNELTAITALGLVGTKKFNDMMWSRKKEGE